jgi:hypothetical protein
VAVAAEPITILALSKMKGGICTAGLSTQADVVTGLRWVRPVRDYVTLLPEDMCHAPGCLARCCDVLDLHLVRPRPEPPHVEDWQVDLIRHRPRLVRHLEGDQRAEFLAAHVDGAPEQVLVHASRSLCLVRPEEVWATWVLDPRSGQYEARLGFRVPGPANHRRCDSSRGVSATDVRWRALGPAWLGARGGSLRLGHADLMARLAASDLYLTVGLSRLYQGEYWPLVVGVHAVPDFEVDIDLGNL